MDILLAFGLIFGLIMAVSYGWGMRGTTIGGEKGAMLPGAIMGTFIAMFSGIYIVKESFFIFTALGAIGTYFGGCMTYGETLSLSMSAKPAIDMKKGLIALFIKGALWFGAFGSIFTTGVSAVSKLYNIIELIIIFALTPALSVLFLKVFNRPVDIDNAKFPKIYFSKTRKEYWGAMLGIVLSLVLINAVKQNTYSIIFTLICALFGGIGFTVGQLVQIYIRHYAKLSSLKLINQITSHVSLDGWKAMECTFGAIGGLGCAVAFFVTKESFKELVFNMEKLGGVLPYNNILCIVLFIIWLLAIGVDTIHYFIEKPLTKLQVNKLKKQGKISDKKHERLIKRATPEGMERFKKAQFYFEVYEFIVYAAVPFILICLGSVHTGIVTSVFTMYWILAQEICFEKKDKKLYEIIPATIIGIVLIILSLVFTYSIKFTHLLILYTVVYELLTLYYLLPEIIAKEKERSSSNDTVSVKEKVKLILQNKSFVVTHGYFIIAIIITLSFK